VKTSRSRSRYSGSHQRTIAREQPHVERLDREPLEVHDVGRARGSAIAQHVRVRLQHDAGLGPGMGLGLVAHARDDRSVGLTKVLATPALNVERFENRLDVTEVAVPWYLLREAGHQVVFATQAAGTVPAADPPLLEGEEDVGRHEDERRLEGGDRDVGMADHAQPAGAKAGPAGRGKDEVEPEDAGKADWGAQAGDAVKLEEDDRDDEEEGSGVGEEQDAVLARELAQRGPERGPGRAWRLGGARRRARGGPSRAATSGASSSPARAI